MLGHDDQTNAIMCGHFEKVEIDQCPHVISTSAYIRTYVHTYTLTYVYTHIHAYIYTYIHTYIRSCCISLIYYTRTLPELHDT